MSSFPGEEVLVPDMRRRFVLWAIAIFVITAFTWAYYAELDELVRSEGKVIPSKQLQVVQNLEGGIISEILIDEGGLVNKGQVLMKMDDTQFSSELQDNQERLITLKIQSERIKAELAAKANYSVSKELKQRLPALAEQEEFIFNSRLVKKSAERETLNQRIAQTEREYSQAEAQLRQARDELNLAKRELDIIQPLYKDGVLSEIELIKVRKEVARLEGQATDKQFELPQVRAKVSEFQNQLGELDAKYIAESQESLSEILSKIARLNQSKASLSDRFARTTVRSPVKGTVKQIFVNTIGGVVQPGMDLVSIVPVEDALLIEAKIKPADIARIFPGQVAMVKFTAYDFSIYGGLPATVSHISADSIASDRGDSYYLVRIKTEKNYMGSDIKRLPIIPGMIVNVDVLAGKRTVLEYLSKALYLPPHPRPT